MTSCKVQPKSQVGLCLQRIWTCGLSMHGAGLHSLDHDRVKESRLLDHESPTDSHAVAIRLVAPTLQPATHVASLSQSGGGSSWTRRPPIPGLLSGRPSIRDLGRV